MPSLDGDLLTAKKRLRSSLESASLYGVVQRRMRLRSIAGIQGNTRRFTISSRRRCDDLARLGAKRRRMSVLTVVASAPAGVSQTRPAPKQTNGKAGLEAE